MFAGRRSLLLYVCTCVRVYMCLVVTFALFWQIDKHTRRSHSNSVTRSNVCLCVPHVYNLHSSVHSHWAETTTKNIIIEDETEKNQRNFYWVITVWKNKICYCWTLKRCVCVFGNVWCLLVCAWHWMTFEMRKKKLSMYRTYILMITEYSQPLLIQSFQHARSFHFKRFPLLSIDSHIEMLICIYLSLSLNL